MHGTTTALNTTQAEQIDGGFFFGVGGNHQHAGAFADGHQVGIATNTDLQGRIIDADIGGQPEAVVN